MAMWSIASTIRGEGAFNMGGAVDRNVVSALNYRFRVAFLGAPSPGARAFHARTPTSPRARESSDRHGDAEYRQWRSG